MDLRFVYSPLPVILASLMRNVISYLMEERDRTRVTVLYLMKGNSERFIQWFAVPGHQKENDSARLELETSRLQQNFG